jgi:hypothetical protein
MAPLPPIGERLERVAPGLMLRMPGRMKVATEEAYIVENYLEWYQCAAAHPSCA